MQWMWYALDTRVDVEDKLRAEMITYFPAATTNDHTSPNPEQIDKMGYLSAVIKETMRIYPPIWVSSREAFEDDYFGQYKVNRGTIIIVPQLVMHRHPRWWDNPNSFVPERFFPENEAKIDAGLYFPFTHGARKCSGYRLAEMEAKIIFTKLLPLFKVRAINSSTNSFEPGITLKLKKPLLAEIIRA
jgi:cytochrome P450